MYKYTTYRPDFYMGETCVYDKESGQYLYHHIVEESDTIKITSDGVGFIVSPNGTLLHVEKELTNGSVLHFPSEVKRLPNNIFMGIDLIIKCDGCVPYFEWCHFWSYFGINTEIFSYDDVDGKPHKARTYYDHFGGITGETRTIHDPMIREDFSDCGNLTRTYIVPAFASAISDYAFYRSKVNDCFDLNRIIIPEEVESIGSYAFKDIKVREIQLPPTLKKMGAGVFYGCHWMKSIILPCGLVDIHPDMLRGWSGTVYIDGVPSIQLKKFIYSYTGKADFIYSVWE